MISAILSGDLPRSRVLSGGAGRDPGCCWRWRRSCSAAPRRSIPRPRSASSSCWWRATICCSATPASSPSPTPCSTGSAATAWGWRSTAGARPGPRRWPASPSRCVAGIALAFLIGLFSLRVRAIFFAMITLAVASAFAILAAQLSDITGGEDGRSFRVPEMLRPGFTLDRRCRSLGADHGPHHRLLPRVPRRRWLLFLAALRIVNSPFGRVLQAIRENDFRAEALGYRTVYYRTVRQLPGRRHGGAGRRAQRAVAALHRARHHAVLRHHARHPADGGDRRHGHHVRRGDRRHAVHPGPELPAEADGHRRPRPPRRCRCCRACCTPTAGCCGSACCSCSASISSRPASSASCGSDDKSRHARAGSPQHARYLRGSPPARR